MNRKAVLGAQLKLDKTGFSAALSAAGAESRRFSSDLSGLGGGSTRFTELASKIELGGLAFRGLGKAAGLAGSVIKRAFEQDLSIDAIARGLSAVSDGAESIKDQFTALRAAAQLPGTGFTEIAQGSLDLQAVGVSAAQSREALVQFGNALATVGKGKDELNGIATAISQIYGKGKVSAEEIGQIAERFPGIRSMLGNVDQSTPDSFLAGVIAELQKLPRAGGNAKDAIDNLKDAYDALLATTSGGRLNKAVSEVANSITEAVAGGDLGAGLQNIAGGFARGVDTVSGQRQRNPGADRFAEYEVSPEEAAKRRRAKEESAARVKAAALQSAEELYRQELQGLALQKEIAEAAAAGDRRKMEALEDELAVLKEAKKIAEALNISEADASRLILQRAAAQRRLQEADPAKAAFRQKTDEDEHIAGLRGRGRNRQADKLEEKQAAAARERQLMDNGYSPEDAKRISGAESGRRADEAHFQRTGRRRIKGAKSREGAHGLGAESHVFEAGNQGADEPLFRQTGLPWQPKNLPRRIQGAGAKKDSRESEETNKPANPAEAQVAELKKINAVLTTIASGGSVASKTAPQSKN